MSQESSNIDLQTSEQKRQLLARLISERTLSQRSEKQAPMSFAQQRLWFLDQLTGHSPLYNMACPQRLRFAVDADILQRCLNEIVRRHESLRTTFAVRNGEPVQIIAPHLKIDLPLEDLQVFPLETRDTKAWDLVAGDALRPFDLNKGPLLRSKLLRLADDDYFFLLTIHHIISDGWSMGVFFRELNVLYDAFSSGKSSPLPELQIQYADFSVWQRKWLQGSVLESQLNYWTRQLDGLSTLELPADRVRPNLMSFRGNSYPVTLDREVIDRLAPLCQEQDVTLFMVLLAAFQVLLYRYSGQEDIVVGSPVANRNRAETEGLIGFFVNSLVMRTNLGGMPTFRELLGRVKETALGAYENQDLPFEILVEKLHPERDLSRNPLFQVVFQLMDTSAMGEMATAEALPNAPALQMGTAKFDLNLTLFATPDGITGEFQYCTDLFDEARIVRMAEHYAKLLDGIAQNPAEKISVLPLLTAAERRQILNEWNATAAEPLPGNVVELVEQNAVKHPNASAIVSNGQTLTYSELNARANQLARHLRERGVGINGTVAICLPRSLELIVAAFAGLKLGAAYAPLDPEHPDDRLNLMLAESGATALVTTATVSERFKTERVTVIRVDEDAALIAQHAETNLAVAYDDETIAYVIFTSGSTGTPKAVEVPHRGLKNLSAWTIRAFAVGPDACATQFASMGFDAMVWEVWPYLAAGASVEIIDDAVRYSPRSLPRWISDHGITHCFVPTPILDTVLAEEWPAECRLRFLLTGGDRLRNPVRPNLPFAVFNQYGPTESSVVATSARVPEGADGAATPPIGRPISNVDLLVVDRNGEPVPVGIPGELWIGGAGLARGYRNSPQLTEERFIPHPLKPERRVYRSGDLVRYLPDGQLEFLGRIDKQIKIRGFRFEPGEVEAVLVRDANVQSVCVLVREVPPGDPSLVAYIIPRSESVVDESALRARARESLPSYMVPSHFVFLNSFPLTENGKIDPARLPLPDRRKKDDGYLSARTPTEQLILGAWQQELGLETVDVDENFFDVGGTSLTLVQIHHRLEEKMPNRLSVVDLFRYPTIRTLAAFLDESMSQRKTVEKARARAERRRQEQRQRLQR